MLLLCLLQKAVHPLMITRLRNSVSPTCGRGAAIHLGFGGLGGVRLHMGQQDSNCSCKMISKRYLYILCPSQVKEVEDEEWSYIPVGGPLPIGRQPITAFGAAASLIHPATGYSLARSLREAPGLAKEVSQILQQDLPIEETAQNVWKALWPPRKRRQVCKASAGSESL